MLELTFFQSPEQLLIIGVVIFLGQVVYSAIGFGSGMITISLLALLYGQLDVFVPFFLILCLPTELSVTLQERKNLDLKFSGRLLFFMLPALIAGTLLLKKIPQPELINILGVVIMAISLFILFYENRITAAPKGLGPVAAAGSLSGLLGALYGISGPPLIVYLKTMKLNKAAFRSSLLSIFLVMSILRIVLYSGFGFYRLKILVSLIPMVPFTLAGYVLGNRLHHKIPEAPFKKITSVILFISGLLLLL